MCEDIDASFSTLIPKCSFVTQYGVMPRYPNELQVYEADVRVALRYAKDIRAFVLAITDSSTANNGNAYPHAAGRQAKP